LTQSGNFWIHHDDDDDDDDDDKISFVIPVIVGATEILTKGLKVYLGRIPEKHSTDQQNLYK
jgi:hypothetical protein